MDYELSFKLVLKHEWFHVSKPQVVALRLHNAKHICFDPYIWLLRSSLTEDATYMGDGATFFWEIVMIMVRLTNLRDKR
jgi:hypothetical protein